MSKSLTPAPQARLLLCSGLLALLGLLASPSHAAPGGLTSDTVNANLVSAADGVNVSDNVTVGSGIEISANVPGTNIGDSGFLLPGSGTAFDGEYVDFQPFTIVLRVLEGSGNTTGWSAGAKWVLSSLDLAAADNLEIYGVSAAAIGGTISNFDATWASFDSPTEVSFALDQIQFSQATSGTTFGEVALTLLTRPTSSVPEPGSIALVGLGLAGLWVGRRRAAVPCA